VQVVARDRMPQLKPGTRGVSDEQTRAVLGVTLAALTCNWSAELCRDGEPFWSKNTTVSPTWKSRNPASVTAVPITLGPRTAGAQEKLGPEALCAARAAGSRSELSWKYPPPGAYAEGPWVCRRVHSSRCKWVCRMVHAARVGVSDGALGWVGTSNSKVMPNCCWNSLRALFP